MRQLILSCSARTNRKSFYTLAPVTWLLNYKTNSIILPCESRRRIFYDVHAAKCSECVKGHAKDPAWRNYAAESGRIPAKMVCAVTLHNVYYQPELWIMHQIIFKVTGGRFSNSTTRPLSLFIAGILMIHELDLRERSLRKKSSGRRFLCAYITWDESSVFGERKKDMKKNCEPRSEERKTCFRNSHRKPLKKRKQGNFRSASCRLQSWTRWKFSIWN